MSHCSTSIRASRDRPLFWKAGVSHRCSILKVRWRGLLSASVSNPMGLPNSLSTIVRDRDWGQWGQGQGVPNIPAPAADVAAAVPAPSPACIP
eukprot:CAMPEP_0173274056 /NCGR_PEP_ID=MMETSP1143-20121109/2239_1 /TAXON_ID=483371 /ORGANISM="non described non described, Strain CCMP2298" /LENGTH=92 /DNA_ID=CAMNT_0014210847 /DNA_START=205 /DNA_END=480 /DNA_ORIENTATION=+